MILSGFRSNTFANTLAGLGFLMGAWGAWTSQKAYDRSAGTSRARLSIGVEGDMLKPYETTKRTLSDAGITNKKAHFQNPGDLVEYGPRIVLENVGSDPIEDVQVETWLVDYIVENPSAAAIGDALVPDPGNRIDRRVYQMPFKLMPGRKAGLSVHAGLISQILDLQRDSAVDQVYRGRFRIRCSPRLVGASKFDEPEDEAGSELDFAWSSGGFSSKNCMEYLHDPDAGSVDYPDSFGGR